MEAFRIWASLNLKGDAQKKMELFQKTTAKAALSAKNLDKSLLPLSEKLLKIDLILKSIQPRLAKLSTNFVRLTTNSLDSSAGIMKFSNSTAAAASRTQTLIRNTEKLSSSLSTVAAKGDIAAASMSGLRGGRIGRAASHGNNNTGLKITNPQLHAGIKNKYGGMGLSFMPGGIGGFALGGALGLGILTHSGFEAQKEFQQQVQQLRGSGLNESQIKEASKIASVTTPGISSIDKIKSLNDAFMASRDWKEAKLLAPMLAQAEFAGKATFKNMTDGQRQALVKFAEMRAGSDMSKIAGSMDLGYRLMNASAGTLDPKQQAMFMRRAPTVAYHLSDRGYAGLEPVLQEMGGQTVGTAFQTGFQMMATGVGTLNNKKRVADLLRLGIYKSGEKDSNGRFLSTSMDKSLLHLYETDPVSFTKKIISIYAKNGTTSSDDIVRRLGVDFPRTTSGFMALIMKNMGKIDRQLGLFDKQPGIASSFQQTFKIPTGASQRLDSAWTSMATAFGKLSSPAVIAGMNLLSLFMEKTASVFTYMNAPSAVRQKRQTDNMNTMGVGYHLGTTLSAPLEGKDGFYSSMLKKQAPPGTTTVNINIDGKKVADAVVPHIANGMSSAGTVSSPSSFNFGMGMPPTSYNNAGNF